MINLFVFDLGKVLLPFEHKQIAEKLHETSKIQNRFTPDTLFQYLFDREHGAVNPYEEGKITSLEFFGKLREKYKLELEFDEFKDIWEPIFEEDPEVHGIISYLKGKGYPVFLLSDTNELHFSYITERYPIVHSIDEWILSYEVGAKKPSERIFNAIFERKKDAERSETLYIDDIAEYVEAARGLGIQGFHFTGAKDLWDLLRKNEI